MTDIFLAGPSEIRDGSGKFNQPFHQTAFRQKIVFLLIIFSAKKLEIREIILIFLIFEPIFILKVTKSDYYYKRIVKSRFVWKMTIKNERLSYERTYLIDYQIPISLNGTYRYKKCPISGQSGVLNRNYVYFRVLSLKT